MPLPRHERLARNPVNQAYERGWREGWAAALIRVEEIGIEAVFHKEKLLPPVPLPLLMEPEGGIDPEGVLPCRE